MYGVAPETPSLFKSLATSMKSMTAAGLSAIYQKIKSKDMCPDNNARVRYIMFAYDSFLTKLKQIYVIRVFI